MNQLNWTVVSNTGISYEIKLMHGPQSGHVLLLNNLKVIRIDFKVKTDKQYSFFVDDELVEIGIHQLADEKFEYSCVINNHIDTPLNRAKKKRDKKFWRYTLLSFAIMFLMVFGLKTFLQRSNTTITGTEFERLLDEKGVQEKVIIFWDEKNNQIKYQFVAGDKIQTKELSLELFKVTYDPILPLMIEQTYMIKVVPDQPFVHRLDLSQPDDATLAKLFDLIEKKHHQLNPTVSLKKVDCLIHLAYELKGLAGIADFYNQDIHPVSARRSNKDTYQGFRQSDKFRAAEKIKCIN